MSANPWAVDIAMDNLLDRNGALCYERFVL
jgi:hypothetical protein